MMAIKNDSTEENITTTVHQGSLIYYYGDDSQNERQNERMMQTVLLWGAYMLLFIPFILCWNAVVRSLRQRRYLSEQQADTLVECAEESMRERINGIRLSSMIGNNNSTMKK